MDSLPESDNSVDGTVGDLDPSSRLTQQQQQQHQQSSRQLRFQNDHHDLTEAFQRYRNYVLDGDYYLTYRSYDVGQCLDECLTDREM